MFVWLNGLLIDLLTIYIDAKNIWEFAKNDDLNSDNKNNKDIDANYARIARSMARPTKYYKFEGKYQTRKLFSAK